MKTRKDRQLKISLIVVGALSVLICGWSLIFRSPEGGSFYAILNGVFCGLILIGSGLGFNELNGDLSKKSKEEDGSCSE